MQALPRWSTGEDHCKQRSWSPELVTLTVVNLGVCSGKTNTMGPPGLYLCCAIAFASSQLPCRVRLSVQLLAFICVPAAASSCKPQGTLTQPGGSIHWHLRFEAHHRAFSNDTLTTMRLAGAGQTLPLAAESLQRMRLRQVFSPWGRSS
jgi:hypothetical protein